VNQKIQILPETLCNQIAAGEVVERPASVLKELVENSLDAGADRILVEVEQGGKRLLRITDNGHGMDRDDAFLCLERHATSKIRNELDLFRLQTLGFRGEALPSIAAVSRMALRTRGADSLEGWEIVTEGGRVLRAGAVGMPVGTVIEVRNLFFNVPARRKFLRRDETELGHLSEALTRLALASPGVHFRLTHNARLLWEVNRQNGLPERIGELLGRDVLRGLVPLQECPEAPWRLHGLLSRPEVHRSTNSGMFSYINGRFIRDRVVQHAIAEGYRHLLPKGRYPLAVLLLELPADLVDVNVHPTKQEVRFREQSQVHDLIVAAVRETLARPSAAPARQPAEACQEPAGRPVQTALTGEVPAKIRDPQAAYLATAGPPPAPSPVHQVHQVHPVHEVRQARPPEPAATLFAPPAAETLPTEPAGYGSMTILGQFRGSYLVCQDGDDLVLVDQHAAHERIGFEKLCAQYRQGTLERQLLLFPLVLEFDLRQAQLVSEYHDLLSCLAFDLEPFGGRSFALKSVPALLQDVAAEPLLRDVMDDLSDFGVTRQVDQQVENLLLKMACHGMVRANQSLTPAEMRALLDQLDQVPFNRQCPHGRPITVCWQLAEVERLFKRG
jgi:DNA mismatch repair protein MutL